MISSTKVKQGSTSGERGLRRTNAMAEKYTEDELTARVKTPGWRLVTGRKDDNAVTGRLEQVLGVTHERHKSGQAPGLIQEIETGIELDMIQIELLWRYLGLPV
jgi:hypothetical protein